MRARADYSKSGVWVHASVELVAAALLASVAAAGARALGVWDGPAQSVGLDPVLEAPIVASVAFAVAAWLSSTKWLSEAIAFLLYSIAVVVIGAALGLVVRELLLDGWPPLADVSVVLTTIFLAVIGIWLWNQMFEPEWVPPKIAVDTFAALLASLVVALSLVSFFVVDWNATIGAWLPWASLSEGDASAALQDDTSEKLLDGLGSLSDRIDGVLGLLTVVLATAATAYVIVFASPKLEEILDYIQLEPAQVKAARKLRRPLSDLIREVNAADLKFKRELFISASSFGRESPIESGAWAGARVKIIAPHAGIPPDTFTFAKIKRFLRRAQIDIRESLFFVYPETGAAAGPICYATGPEFWELMHKPGDDTSEETPPEPYEDGMPGSGRFRGAFSDSFFGALNSGNARAIAAVIENARDAVLKDNPQDDLLLTSFSLPDSEELLEALTKMKEHGLRRALVYSGKVPAERAILTIPHIAHYLAEDGH